MRVFLGILVMGVLQAATPPSEKGGNQEVHLTHLQRLTTRGDNAEAYFSWDGTRLTYQSMREGFAGDQIFVLDLKTGEERMISTGKGRTTCSYFLPGDSLVLFSSTHETLGDQKLQGGHYDPELHAYVWPLYNYDIYVRNLRTGELKKLFGSPGYDAEATVGKDGRIVFTSTFEGDMELYILDPPYNRPPRRVTHQVGYDGGAFFTDDGRYLVYRGWHPTDSAEIAEYRSLLKKGLMKGVPLQLFVYDLVQDTFWQVTHNQAVNFAPYPFHNEKRIIFSSSLGDPRMRTFHLWVVNFDGTGLQRVTSAGTFNAFPMFSPDGKKLVWASNRFNPDRHLSDIVLADWKETTEGEVK